MHAIGEINEKAVKDEFLGLAIHILFYVFKFTESIWFNKYSFSRFVFENCLTFCNNNFLFLVYLYYEFEILKYNITLKEIKLS